MAGGSRSAESRHRVVFSLTTNPVRIARLAPTLKSLCAQSFQPDRVYLNLPLEHSRFPGVRWVLPAFLSSLHLVHTHFVGTKENPDYGPATKLLGVLSQESDPDTLITIVDGTAEGPATPPIVHLLAHCANCALKSTSRLQTTKCTAEACCPRWLPPPPPDLVRQ
eukprot:1548835-Prymnesium_polylepis.3